jgi:hypothetical protein
MNISSRESLLGWVTGFVILFGATYIVCRPQFEAWNDRQDRTATLENKIAKAEELLARESEWDKRLTVVRETMQPLPENRQVATHLKKTIGDMAAAVEGRAGYHVSLRDRISGEERNFSGLCVMPITCPWEGNTLGIVKLLVDFLEHDVMFDVTELMIRSSGKDDLRGSFTVNCVYIKSREKH